MEFKLLLFGGKLDGVSGKILGVTERANYFFGGLSATSWPVIVLDILIVSVLIYWVYVFLRQTRAMRILYGLLILVALMLLGQLLDLVLLNWILRYIMAMLVVAIPIVFQPELRAALEKLGRSKLVAELNTKESRENTTKILIETALLLSRDKTGALIIIQRKTGLRELTETGITINAKVSSELLGSIFMSKSPLHDGAVIIVGEMIEAASVTLPVSEKESGSKLGMRHRAAIGVTEESDAIALVVSEENGYVSISVSGEIEKRVSEERLRSRLSALLRKK